MDDHSRTCPGARRGLRHLPLRALLLAALALSPALAASAAMLTVTNTTDDPTNSGSLRYAISNAQAGDTVVFSLPSPSVITLTAGELDLTQSVTIQGPGAGALTVSGGGVSRVFDVTATGPVGISGLTVTSGTDPDGNGGGGVLMDGTDTLTLTGCALTNNTGQNGAGLLDDTTAVLSNCTLSGNTAQGAGGGIGNYGTLTLTGCTLSGNTAAIGGGLTNQGMASLTDCTLATNSGGSGGGLFNIGGLVLTDCTLAANSASGDGGGLFNDDGDGGMASLQAVLVAGNTAAQPDSDVVGAITSLGYNLVQTPGSATGFDAAHDLLGVSPTLGPLQNNGGPTQTLALLVGSPGIAADASITGVPATDQRGVARPHGIKPDIGAYQTTLTATNDAYTVPSSSAYTVPAASGVLANDMDGYGGATTAVLGSTTADGALTLNTNGSFTYTPALNATGTDSFTYQAKDANGALSNVATVTLTLPVAPRSTTPPTTTATLNPAAPDGANGWYRSHVQVTFAATDPTDSPAGSGSAVAATVYTLDGGSPQTYTVPFTITSEGTHTLTFHSTDKLGNVEADHSLSIKIDATAPVTTAAPVTTPSTGTAAASAQVTLMATDTGSGIATTDYTLDGGAQQTYTTGTPVVITGTGSHTLTYHSADRAGNVETAHSLSLTLTGRILHTFAPGMQMISVPEDFRGVSLTSAWGAPAGQTLYDWAASTYVTTTALPAPGQGAWVSLTQSADLYDTGTPTATAAPFAIALSPGWNMIGDPFPSGISMSAVTVRDGQGRQWTLPQAGGRSLIALALYSYSAAAAQYQGQGLSGTLVPYQGYWLYATQNCTLLIPPPASAPGVRRR